MPHATDLPPARTRRWRYVRRGVAVVALAYLGCLLVLLALENWFVYRPATAAESWLDATDPAVRDVYFDLPTGDTASLVDLLDGEFDRDQRSLTECPRAGDRNECAKLDRPVRLRVCRESCHHRSNEERCEYAGCHFHIMPHHC